MTFAERGAKAVVFADLDQASAVHAAVRSKLIATSKEYGTMGLAVDVRKRASVKLAVEKVKQKFGRIDYAVNCAGVSRYAFSFFGS